ncbi:hypothetical protein AQUSIP_18980 [Aquicella siphonis]|uniref:Uncharacterized protein n=1 Tax=Aquicella siphonis TaxID=254247 RepID=A0A5E4PJQ4_9COXI|nr:hypothetical protein AQUSIP_18980 [Aquicella siphonis]
MSDHILRFGCASGEEKEVNGKNLIADGYGYAKKLESHNGCRYFTNRYTR